MGFGWVRIFALVVAWTASAQLVAAKPRKVPLDALHPTQFTYGAYEVGLKRKELDAIADKEGGLGDYKKKNPGSVIVGPGGVFYLIDGHHLAHALIDRGSQSMFVTIEEDWSDLSEEAFWERMVTKRRCYLRELGVQRAWKDLPSTFDRMTDDPYRSLAWLVRKKGGYRELSTPFQEFAWAEFFRSRITLGNWKDATKEGVKLAQSPAARTLPGWCGEDCGKKLGN